MVFIIRTTLIIGLLIINVSTIAAELTKGELQGTVTMHQEQTQLVKFKVNKNGKITMYYNQRAYRFENLTVGSKEMTFELNTGSDYNCQLERLDQKYSGNCFLQNEEDNQEEKRTIKLEMLLPEKIEEQEL